MIWIVQYYGKGAPNFCEGGDLRSSLSYFSMMSIKSEGATLLEGIQITLL